MNNTLILTAIICAMSIPFLANQAHAKPEIIAHRGASFDAPENTLAAINLAWKLKADAVEIDVYLTTDHRIVVIHDATTKRVAGIDKEVSKSSYEELRALDVGKWKDAKWTGERIPALEEVLKTIPKGKRLFIEIQSGPKMLPDFFKVLDASGVEAKRVAVTSFNSDVIRDIKVQRPNLKAYLCQSPTDSVSYIIGIAKTIHADGVNSPAQISFDANAVKQLREAKLGVYVWTIDDAATVKQYADMGVDGILTNKLSEVKASLKRRK